MPIPCNSPVLVGARALDGALARLSPHDNRIPFPADDASAGRLSWGQWPDWDNGHADGGYAGGAVAVVGGGVRARVTIG